MNNLENLLSQDELVEVIQAVWDGMELQEQYSEKNKQNDEEKKGNK